MCAGCVDRTLNVTVDAMALRMMSLPFSIAGTLGPVLSTVIADLLEILSLLHSPSWRGPCQVRNKQGSLFYEPAIVSIVYIQRCINERMPINVPRYLHLDLSKHVMRNISRFHLRAHTLKVEAAAWREDGSCVCDQCPGEDEHVQNEVHALLICQDHRVCELRKHFSFLFSPFRTFQQPNPTPPFCCNRSTTNLFMIFSAEQ